MRIHCLTVSILLFLFLSCCSSQKPELFIEAEIVSICDEETALQTVEILTNRLKHIGVNTPDISLDYQAKKINFTLPCGDDYALYEHVITNPYQFMITPLVPEEIANSFIETFFQYIRNHEDFPPYPTEYFQGEFCGSEPFLYLFKPDWLYLPSGVLIHRKLEDRLDEILAEEEIKRQTPGTFILYNSRDHYDTSEYQAYLLADKTNKYRITNSMLTNATVKVDAYGFLVIDTKLDPAYKSYFYELTKETGVHLPIIVDNKIISNPRVNSSIKSGRIQIASDLELEELRGIASGLECGVLPIKLQITKTEILTPDLTSLPVKNSLKGRR